MTGPAQLHSKAAWATAKRRVDGDVIVTCNVMPERLLQSVLGWAVGLPPTSDLFLDYYFTLYYVQ